MDYPLENLKALQAIERGEKPDQDILVRLHEAKLIDITSVDHMQAKGPELMFVGFTPDGFQVLKKSKAPLVSDLERQMLNTVVRGFLDHHQPTSKRALLQQLQSSISDELQRLTGRGVLALANNTYPNETYLPKTLAFFHCGDPAALTFARKSTQIVLRVLPILFNKDLASGGEAQKQFTPEDVLTEAKAIDSSIEPDAVFTGLYLAQECSVFSSMRMGDRNFEVVSFSLGERVYEKRYLDWDERIRQGNISLIYDQQSQLKKDTVPVSVPSNLELIVTEGLEPYSLQGENSMPIQEQRMNSLAVLISHSSKDHQLASALIDFLRSGLGLLPKQIRCSSVDGYRLPAGVHTDSQLRDEVTASKVLIGLITPNSLSSPYVLFELGARWGAGETMIPLLAGVTADQLRGPLSGMNALLCNSEEQLHQALDEIGSHLGLEVQSPAAYLKQLRAVVERAENPVASNASSATTVSKPKPKLVLSVGVTGTPPEPQLLHIKANQPVKATRLEYLLSSGASVASGTLNMEGESLDIPIEDAQVLKVWNTPRPDRNWSDHSGPAKLRLTLLVDGVENAYTIPVQMDSYYHANTFYRKLSGSESFRGD